MSEKYVCSYCGAEYGSAPARARRELECDEKRKQEAEREHKMKLNAEKDKRLEAIRSEYSKLVEMCDGYSKDYGTKILWPWDDCFRRPARLW